MVLTCPDLVSVCQAVVSDRLMETLYVSPAGPIAPIDVLYGHRDAVASGKLCMAHKTGFSLLQFAGCFLQSWVQVQCRRRPADELYLWIVAFKQLLSNEAAMKIAVNYLP